MTGVRISDMTPKASLAPGDIVPIESGGDNYGFDLGAALNLPAGDAALFSACPGMTIGAGIKSFRTAGFSAAGLGAAIYITASDVDSAFVTANPLWSFRDASGQGWRIAPATFQAGGRFIIDQFGADPVTSRASSTGAKTAAATANFAAWKAMRECALYYRTNAVDVEGLPTTSRTGFEFCTAANIGFGYGNYWFGGNPLQLTEGTFDVGGQGRGNIAGFNSAGTIIEFDGSCDGFVIHHNTSYTGPEKLSPTGGCSGTRIHDLMVDGGAGPLDMAHPRIGFWARAVDVALDRVGALDFASCGFVAGTRPTLDDDIAFADDFILRESWAVNCGYAGLYMNGGDSNAGGTDSCSFINTGYFGIYDSSFLANGHKRHHARGMCDPRTAGTTTHKITGVVWVSHNGYYWHCVFGQEAAASTTEPGTDPRVWLPWIFESPPDLTFAPAWVSGHTYASGGSYVSDGATSPSTFIDCYTEGLPGPWTNAGIVMGGEHQSQQNTGGCDLRQVSGDFVNLAGGIGTQQDVYDSSVSSGGLPQSTTQSILGGEYALRTVWRVLDSLLLPSVLRAKIGSGGDFTFLDYGNSSGTEVFKRTGPGTALAFDRSAPVPHATVMPNLFVGSGNEARQITAMGAVPASGNWGQGDFVLDNTSASIWGWSCRTSGTPGTWDTLYRRLYGSKTYDPPSIAAGLSTSTTVTVAGAATGDMVSIADFGASIAPLSKNAWVSGANTVTVELTNPTAGAIDLGSMTLKVEVVKQ